MTDHDGYFSDPDGITAGALADVALGDPTVGAVTDIKVYLIDMTTGDRTPIVAVMMDKEGDDAPNLYLYTEPA
jgi:hypothetical protein